MLVVAVIESNQQVKTDRASGRVREASCWLRLGALLLLSSGPSCAGRADLVPGPGPGPLLCRANEERLSIEVLNQGGKSSRATTTVLRYENRPSIQLPTRPIQPQGKETLTAQLPEDCLWSDCSFEIEVDSRDEVAEKREDNNRLPGHCSRAGRKQARRP